MFLEDMEIINILTYKFHFYLILDFIRLKKLWLLISYLTDNVVTFWYTAANSNNVIGV